MYQKDTLVVVPDKDDSAVSGGFGVKYLNVNNYAQRFAEVPNSFNIFLIEACRVQLSKQVQVNEQAEPAVPLAKKLPGISLIIHSCEPGAPTTEF